MRFAPKTFMRKMHHNANRGSATFHGSQRTPGAPGLTLDETLALIEKEQHRQARLTKRPPTRAQLLGVAKAIAKQPRRQAKVKMPVFSIQQD